MPKNENPLHSITQLDKEINYKDFVYKNDFKHICNLKPHSKNGAEHLEVIPIEKNLVNELGFVYIFVIENKIFKIGSSINSIYNRISSYNCGRIKFRMKGTCSTTNYFVLQSFLKFDEVINLYGYFPEKQKYKVFNEEGIDVFPSAKIVEKKVLKDFKEKYNKLPIGCSQK